MPTAIKTQCTPVSERHQIANSLNFLSIYLQKSSETASKLSLYHRLELNSNLDLSHELTSMQTDLRTYSNRLNTILEMLADC